MANTIGNTSAAALNAFLEKQDKVGAPAVQADATHQASGRAATNGHDAATLSDAGSVLSAVGSASDDVRADKVAALRTAIYNGTYHVPAAAVADSLIKNLQG